MGSPNHAVPAADGGRGKRLLYMHLGLAAGLAVYVFLIGRCPILWATGVPCPGCGLTRAYEALLRLDMTGAFYYHPLFWSVPPAVLYLAHRRAWRLPGGVWTKRILPGCLAAAFFLVYGYRLFWMPESPIYADFEQSAVYRLWHTIRAVFS